MTRQQRAPALHFALRTAVGAAVEDAVEPVRAERLVDHDAVVSLPGKVIKREHVIQDRIQLGDGLLPYLLARQKAPHGGTHRDLALLQAVVERVAGKGTLGQDADHRHVQPLEHHAELSRQRRGAAVKAVARLRVEQHAAFFLLQRVAHVGKQRHVGDEFVRRDAAEAAHQPLLAHKAVRRAHDAVGLGVEDLRDDLQINKAGVVHHNQIRPLAQLVHPLAAIGEVRVAQVGRRQHPHQRAHQKTRPHGRPVRGTGQGKHLLIVHGLCLDLHGRPPFSAGFV